MAKTAFLSVAHYAFTLNAPDTLIEGFQSLFHHTSVKPQEAVFVSNIDVLPLADFTWQIESPELPNSFEVSGGQIFETVLDLIWMSIQENLDQNDLIIESSSISLGKNAAMITGNGASFLAAWFADNGFELVSDRYSILTNEKFVLGIGQFLSIDRMESHKLQPVGSLRTRASVLGENKQMFIFPKNTEEHVSQCRFRCHIEVDFLPGTDAHIELGGNAEFYQNFHEKPFCIKLTYGDFSQIDQSLISLVRNVLTLSEDPMSLEQQIMSLNQEFFPRAKERQNAIREVIRNSNELRDSGDYQGALDMLSSALANHEDAQLHSSMGHMLKNLGRFDDAEKSLRKSIELDPNQASTYLPIAKARVFEKGDPLFEKIEECINLNELNPMLQARLWLALGKMYEDIGNFSEAFASFKKGKDIESIFLPWGPARERYQSRIDKISDLRKKIDLRDVARSANNDDEPIFVSGLPRSGTTVTSQILASHSRITSVGEAPWGHQLIHKFLNSICFNSGTYSQIEDKILEIGQQYLLKSEDKLTRGHRFVDKAVLRQFDIGILLAAIPRAKAIFLCRDPRDNLLSIYKNGFVENAIPFNNDIDAISWITAKANEEMSLWKSLFPKRILTVDYNSLVRNPETTVHHICEFCELDWEDSLLKFHLNDNVINTNSFYQARQPLYSTSVDLWRNYHKDLDAIMQALTANGCFDKELRCDV